MADSEPIGRAGRILAVLIALAAWIGLGIDLFTAHGDGRSLVDALWRMLAFFTVCTNLALALAFTRLALGHESTRRESRIAGLTVTIVLVGLVYAMLLHGTFEISGLRKISSLLLHAVTPILTLLFWLTIAPKGRLQMSDVLGWTLLPLVYLAYSNLRGALTGFYPYPFMDPTRVGWPATLIGMAGTAGLFLLLGGIVLALDRMLATRGSAPASS